MEIKIARYKHGGKVPPLFPLNKENTFSFNEHGKNAHLNQLALNSINPIIDSEKVLYYPIQTDELVFYIKENDIQKYYSDYGFIQEDIDVNSNRFKNTQLRINFFDSASPSSQALIYQLNLNTQGNEYQRGPDGSLYSVSALPVIFNIETPFKNIRKKTNSLGYGIPFFKTPVNYEIPLKIYVSFSLLNALDGKQHRLYSSNVPLNVSNLYEYLYVTYTLNTLNGKYFYTLDSSNRLINTNGLKKEISLNILNVS